MGLKTVGVSVALGQWGTLVGCLTLAACGDADLGSEQGPASDGARPSEGEVQATVPADAAVRAMALADRLLSFHVRQVKLDPQPSRSGAPMARETVVPVVETGKLALESTAKGLRPAAARKMADVELLLPLKAVDPFVVKDPASGIELGVRLEGTSPVGAVLARELAVYADALGPSTVMYHNARLDGVEDFVLLPDDSRSELAYDVSMRQVAGLRLVNNTLEFLNASGDPRLRMAPPYVVDSAGTARWAMVRVEGCAYDTSTASPWDRPVVSPGKASCRVFVEWDAQGLVPPLVVDPAWTATSSMATKRYGHAMSAPFVEGGISRLLVCGGVGPTGSFLSSCEKRNNSNNTFAAGPAMNIPRAYFTLFGWKETGGNPTTEFIMVAGGWTATTPHFFTGTASTEVWFAGSSGNFIVQNGMSVPRIAPSAASSGQGRVLVTGGFHENVYHSSAQVFNFSLAPWWSSAANMPQPRTFHSATTLRTNGQIGTNSPVLVVGGLNAQGVPNTAIRYENGGWVASGTSPNLQVYAHTATQLVTGTFANQVLVAGGFLPSGQAIRFVHKYNPAAGGTWQYQFSNACADRAWHAAALIDTGSAVAWMGGELNGISMKLSCIWTPIGLIFDAMVHERTQFPARVISGNKVLVAGGYRSQAQPGGPISEAELGNL